MSTWLKKTNEPLPSDAGSRYHEGMSSASPRPSFSLPTDLSVDELVRRLSEAVSNNSDQIAGKFKSQHAIVTIVDTERHFWSPWLSLEVRDAADNRELFGRFSPHPSIWTGFVFTYLAMLVLSFFSAMIGVSQVLAKQPAFGFWLIPIWLGVCGCLWIASQIGQRLAHDQMRMLKKLIENAIGNDDVIR